MTAPSQIDIISTALVQVGHQPIPTLDGDVGNAARLIYNSVVRHLLSLHYWRFTLSEAELAQLASVSPITEWTYAYTLPTDILVPVGLTSYAPYTIKQGKLYCDQAEDVNLVYVAEVGVSYFPAYFTQALIDELAMRYAFSIADNTQRGELFRSISQKSLQIAKAKDSQTGQPASLSVSISDMLARYPATRP